MARTPKEVLDLFGLGAMYNDLDPLMPTYQQLAASYKKPKMNDTFIPGAIAGMIARQILTYKKTPGDCPLQASYSFGPGGTASKAAGFAGLGASTAAAGAGVAASTGAIAGATAATVAEAASVIGLAVLPFTVWGIFSAHHAAAVAKEQATDCEIASYVNTSLVQIDQMLASGQITADSAIAAIRQLRTQASNAVHAGGTYHDCNAICYLEQAMFALLDLKIIIYKTAVTNSNVPEVAKALVQSNNTVVIALAAVAAHFAGVF